MVNYTSDAACFDSHLGHSTHRQREKCLNLKNPKPRSSEVKVQNIDLNDRMWHKFSISSTFHRQARKYRFKKWENKTTASSGDVVT